MGWTYGATYTGTYTSKFYKIRISDWTLQAQRAWTGKYFPHSAQLVTYSNRSEMYVTSSYDDPSPFAKVNCSDLTYTSVNISAGLKEATDDMACRYVDDNGAMCYIGADIGSTNPNSFAVNTALMTVSTFSTGVTSSYGMFIYNGNLYNLGSAGTITRYKNFNTAAPEIFSISPIVPNEFFYSSTGKMYVTDWNNASSLIEFKLPD